MSLVGLQKNITIFIYEICKSSMSNISPATSLIQIAEACKTTISSAKKSIQRLEQKNIIYRSMFKNGRSGWTCYKLKETIYKELLQLETGDKLRTNRGQSGDKVGTKLGTELETNVSSSSSNIYKKTTTTGEVEKQNYDPKWLEIDFEPLVNIGFTQTHLIQLAIQKILSTEQVQNSIYAFSFDLEHNSKQKVIKGNPLNFFMGILRKGLPYTYPANYESSKEREMRLYIERIQELENKRMVIEKEAFDLAFKEWFYRLKDEEIKEFLSPNIPYTKGSKLAEGAAREHFTKEIWENKRSEIIGEKSVDNLSQEPIEKIE